LEMTQEESNKLKSNIDVMVFLVLLSISIYLSTQGIEVINLLLIEATSIASIYFFSRILHDFTKGSLVDPILDSLKWIGLAIAFWLPLFLISTDFINRLQTTLLLFIAIIVVLYVALRSELEKSSYPLFIAASSATILVIGLLLGLWIITTQMPGSQKLGTLISISGIISATFPLFNLFGNKTNPYYSFLSRSIGRDFFKNFLLVALGLTYIFFIRGSILEILGTNYSALIMIEWASLTISFFFIYRRARSYVSYYYVRPDLHADWTKHKQIIETFDEKNLVNWSLLIDGFVERGEKNLLSITLVDLLRNYNAPLQQIQVILAELIDYNDPGPGLLHFSMDKDQSNEQKVERRELVNTVIQRIGENYG
jgi:hypothetical protein